MNPNLPSMSSRNPSSLSSNSSPSPNSVVLSDPSVRPSCSGSGGNPSSLRNPNSLPFNRTSLTSDVLLDTSFQPSCSNGDIPPLQPTKLKTQRRKTNKQKALTTEKPLSPHTKNPKRAKTLTLDKPNPPCSECGKQFLSAKALHGHMRCHPERNWRGMNRPSSHVKPDLEPIISDSLTELSEYELQAVRNIVLISEELFAEARAKEREKSSKKRKGGEIKMERGESSGVKKQRNESEIKLINGGSSHVEKKIFVGFDLDLNLPPPMETEEGVESEPSPNPNSSSCD